MIFNFIKYIRPTHYFNLKNKNGEYVYPEIAVLSKEVLAKLKVDKNYQTNTAQNLDLVYQALEKGYIGSFKKMKYFPKLPVVDEYRFVRKYFSSFCYSHTFLLRILSFKNPIKEVYGFLKSLKVSKEQLHKYPIAYSNWFTFESDLVKSNPKVSVIIPTLNRYVYLKDVLKDLEQQDYQNFEVIVVDQSEPFQQNFYKDYNLDIQCIHQKEKALWLARNTAIQTSDADYLLFFDDDSRVEPNWISTHLKCLDFFKADISSGVSISKVGDKVPENYAYFKYSDQLDTGNVLIKRKVFNTIGLFDRQFEKQRMGDGEFGLRAYLEGFVNISNPFAQRLHLKVGTGGLRQMGAWDAFRNKNCLGPKPIPSVLYLFRKYYGNKAALQVLINTIPKSIMPYKYKANNKLNVLGYVLFLFVWPLVLFQVLKSWKLSSIKLKQGILT